MPSICSEQTLPGSDTPLHPSVTQARLLDIRKKKTQALEHRKECTRWK